MKRCNVISKNKLTTEDIVVLSDNELLKSGNLSFNEIKELKKSYSRKIVKLKNAHELDLERSNQSRISMGCQKLNDFLNGGLKRGCITEIFGESGSGKTQIALQIAVNAWKSGAVYLYTEDAFPSKRLNEMIQHLAASQNKQIINYSEYGDKIFVLQIKEIEDLMKCITTQLQRLLTLHPSISVIILDSVAAPFRGNYQEANSHIARTEHLKSIAMGLLKYAKNNNLAILCINQVSSNFGSQECNSIVPCLGLVWSNMITTRLHVSKTKYYAMPSGNENILDRNNYNENECISSSTPILNIREIRVKFSPDSINDICHNFIVTSHGVNGID